ncbi:hypothetical protein ABIB83_009076 [Bradyrhizobium sp. I1.8.5]
MRRVDQHEMRGGPPYLGAGHHEAEMPRLDMRAAGLEAMVHGHAETGPVAAQAKLDAAGHVF